MKIGLALAAVLSVASLASAQPIDTLPEFSGKFYLTVVFDSPMTPECEKLYLFLRSDPGMRQLTAQTNYNEWLSNDVIVQKTEWQNFLGTVRPAILLQARAEKNGTADVVFFARGTGVQPGPTLVGNIRRALASYRAYAAVPANQRPQWQPGRGPLQCTPRGCFPRREEQQQATPDTGPPEIRTEITPLVPTVDVDVEIPSVDTPQEEGGGDEGIPLIALLLVAAAGAAGLYFGEKQD